MKVLLLNQSEEILNVVPWQRAVTLLISGRARAPYGHEDVYNIPTSRGTYSLPTAIVLTKYVKVPYKEMSATRENLFKRDRYSCQYCAKKVTWTTGTLDHVQPESRGGRWSWKNMVVACKPCNSAKGDRTPEEARMPLLRKPHVPTRDILVLATLDQDGHSSWGRWVDLGMSQ